jgi:DNA-directed RNA polymerase alpha subunit
VIRIKSEPAGKSAETARNIEISQEARLAIARGVKRGDPIAELEYLGLSVRHINLLENSKFQITWLEQLVSLRREELLEIPNFSSNMLSDVLECLARYNKLDEAKRRMPSAISGSSTGGASGT